VAPHRTGSTAPRDALSAAPRPLGGPLYRRPLVLDILFDLALLSFSSLAFALSFPGFASPNGWFPLAYVALAPLFLVARRARWAATPFYGVFFGWLSYLLYNYWLGRFHPLTLFVVPPIHAAYFLVLLPLLKLADAAFPVHGYAVQALLWICYERFLKTEGFLAYSYGNLGYSQWQFLPLVRTAALWGVWGVSAVVVFPSALLAAALRGGLRRLGANLRRRAVPAAAWVVVLAAAVGYGVATKVDFEGVRRWKVALVQQNMDPWKGGVRAYAAGLERLLRQSDAALAENPELVVWSETAFVPAIDWHTRYRPSGESYQLVRTLREYLDRQTVPFLIGNDDGQLARNAAGEEVRVDYNAAILFDRGRIVDTYRKLHLVPFTENFPFERQLPGVVAWLKAADTHFWQKGDRWTVFEAGGVRFSTPICFEDTFGYLGAGFFRRGAEALVNITNDAWSFSVPGAMQHMTMAVFRAAEARRSVVRATNAGITCLIDPNGRVLETLPAFTEGVLVGEVPLYTGGTTPYVRWGDWFPLVAAALLVPAAAWAVVRRRREHRAAAIS
jgi:apolipoprotein N-acyltransferase